MCWQAGRRFRCPLLVHECAQADMAGGSAGCPLNRSERGPLHVQQASCSKHPLPAHACARLQAGKGLTWECLNALPGLEVPHIDHAVATDGHDSAPLVDNLTPSQARGVALQTRSTCSI